MKIRFSDDILTIAEYAREEAMRTGWRGIGADHLMLAILRHGDNEACRALSALGLSLSEFKSFIDSRIFEDAPVPYNEMSSIKLSNAARSIFSMSAFEALKTGTEEVTPGHLLLALSRTSGNATADYFLSGKITPQGLSENISAQASAPAPEVLPKFEDIAGALGEQLSNLFGAKNGHTGICS